MDNPISAVDPLKPKTLSFMIPQCQSWESENRESPYLHNENHELLQLAVSAIKQAYTLSQLKRHSKVHLRKEGKFKHLKINGEYRCKICRESKEIFLSKKLLSAHLSTHKIRDLQEAGYSTIVIRELKQLEGISEAIECQDDSEQSMNQQVGDIPKAKSAVCTLKHRLKVAQTQTYTNEYINFSVSEKFLASLNQLVEQELQITIVLEAKAMIRECYELRLLQHAPSDLFRPISLTVQYKVEDFIKNFENGLGVWQDFKFMLLNNKLRIPCVDQLKGFCYKSRIMSLSLENYDCKLTHILGNQVDRLYFQRCALQLLAGISNLHSQGIVHRYLKPCNNVKVRGDPDPQIFISNFKYSSIIDQVNQDEFIPMDIHLCLRDPDAVRIGDLRQDNYSFLAILLHFFVGKNFKQEVSSHESLAVFAVQLHNSQISTDEVKLITTNTKDQLKLIPDIMAIRNLFLQLFKIE